MALNRRAALGLLPLFAAYARAQTSGEDAQWPTRPIRFIVSAAPGSAGDVVCRIVTAKLGERLGQQFVMDNRPAASGTLAAEDLARATPDGYTIGMATTTTHVIAKLINSKLSYDPVQDFAPIAMIGSSPYVLAVYPGLPVNNVAELIALGKSKQPPLNNAAFGTASLGYLGSVRFAQEAGITLNQISYRSSAQAVIDVVAGRVEMQFSTLPPAVPLVRAGKLRALATTGLQRVPALPEIPTLAESGLPGFDVALWIGIAAPAGISPFIVDKLNREITAILKSADACDALLAQGFVAEPNPPQFLADRISGGFEKWRPVVAKGGLAEQ